MARLPENVLRVLEKTVAKLQVKENVYGVGLFGSWSRGEAETSSDVDLLLLDRSDFGYEYVERVEIDGVFIDLDHIPKKWVLGIIPPEIDQKLYEMQILYDRNWSLNNARLLMAKSYGAPERVDIRTEARIVDSDIYLSRATSAFFRGDFGSAQLFTIVALEKILNVLIEIAVEPFSNSHFLERLEVSLGILGKRELFDEYLELAGLVRIDDTSAKKRFRLFGLVWNEMKDFADQNRLALEASHFEVRTKLDYYLNPAFLRGMVLRINSLIDSSKTAEAVHYVIGVFLDVIENYVWLKSSVDKVGADFTVLLRSLELLERKHPKNHNNVAELLNLGGLDRFGVAKTIEEVHEIILRVRRERKVLIKKHLIRG